MRNYLIHALALAMFVMASGGMAEAAIVRLDFSGLVNELDDPDGILASLLPGHAFEIGDAVAGFYEIDTVAAPYTSGPAAEGGTFYHLDTVGEIEADVGANPPLVGLDLLATVQVANSLVVPEVPDPFDFWQYRQILVVSGVDALFLCLTLFDTTDGRLGNEDFMLADSYTGWEAATVSIAHISDNAFVRTVLTATSTHLSTTSATGPASPIVLHGAVPNPFNPQATIAFELSRPSTVSLRVFDVAGRLVRTLIGGEAYADGRHQAVWNGRDASGRQMSSGTYFYRLEAGAFRETRSMVLVK